MPRSAELIHEAVREQAARHPAAAALVHPGGTVTYGELDRWSDELAHDLAASGVGPGRVVAVLLPPSAALAAVLLGILKCGAAYAAVDPTWPGERLRRIEQLLPGQLVVAGSSAVEALGDDGSPRPDRVPPPGIVAADAAAAEAFAGRRLVLGDDGSLRPDCVPPPPAIVAADGAAAMVFFSSGSTGEPKAVLSPHRATLRLFPGCTFARFDRETVMPQISAVPWDAFALELWGPLTTGGTCVVVTERPLTPAGLREVIAEHAVNTVFLTTSLFHLAVEEDPGAFAGLHTVVAGGEKLSPRHARAFLTAWPDLRLVNGYGPVETAVFALTHDVRAADVSGEIPLGRPVPRTRVLVMRPDGPFGEPCAPGGIGELCIAGDGLALGYLGADSLTAEKFVTAAIDGRPLRMYRTGDLGRCDEDGVFHFHGRLDRQVKVRGHRLEPAGIEHVAGQVPGVRRCLVAVPRDATGNAAALMLFYLPTDGRPTEAELIAALRASLPAYSVPDRVVALDALPLTTTGKVDTTALLAAFPLTRVEGAPGVPALGADAAAADGGSVEDAVAAEFAALLGLAEVDRSASVFALGGSSLTVVRLCTRLGARFGRAIPVSQVMKRPTVADLAGWIDAECAAPVAQAAGAAPEPHDDAPLTPMQHSFVLQHLMAGADTANHCVLSWTISGPLSVSRLAAALAHVHARHGYLSAGYDVEDEPRASHSGRPAEFIQSAADDAATADALLEEQLRRPMDLEAGVVWRAVLVRERESATWLFAVVVHHVAFDGWSQHLLAGEIGLAYAARGPGGPPLPEGETAGPAQTYRMLEELAGAVDLTAERAYWVETLSGMPDVTWPPPTDAQDDGARSIEYPLPDDLLREISRQATYRGVSLLTVLLDSVAHAVAAHTGQRDFGVGIPVSRRSSEALQRPIGCLIDTVCVRLRPGESAADTAEAVGGALANADLSFADVVQALRPPRTGRNPLYQVIAALQDSPFPRLSLEGCRTQLRRRHEVQWSQAELRVELFATPGVPAWLRVSRDPARVSGATLDAVTQGVVESLRRAADLAADRERSGGGFEREPAAI